MHPRGNLMLNLAFCVLSPDSTIPCPAILYSEIYRV